jgi:excisionase family DNA binding protein
MIETTKTSEWLTPREAGEYLGVETTTIYKYLKLKENPLPCVSLNPKTIRINKEKLEDWIATYNLDEGETK